jgi:transposase-like protein
MNDKVTISTFQLFALFPDSETARKYLEGRLWPNGVKCPVCANMDNITTRKAGFYRCNDCAEDFTVRTGTVMERSHVPLHKWLYAMYLLVTGISSMQLSKEIGITQKSAWFLLHRLREACGGKEGNKHKHKKLNLGRGSVGKAIVVGLRDLRPLARETGE